ncbi:MAG: hypothetical protein V4726_11025 [Verrucomicrobiota bacterium]
MKSDFVAAAARDGMEGEQLEGLRKDLGMNPPGVKAPPPAANTSTDSPSSHKGGGISTGTGDNADSEDTRRGKKTKGTLDSIRSGFARQAGTGRGAVNWNAYVGRQIGLTRAQRTSLLRGGPDADSLGGMTGRGQSRRAKRGEAAAAESAKNAGQQKEAAKDRLLQELAKNVEIIAKAVKEDGKL